MDDWILEKTKARSLRRVVAALGVLAVIALLALGSQRYIQNFIDGPYDLDAAELLAIHDVSSTPRYFVRVSGFAVRETGIQEVTVRKRGNVETGRSVTSTVYALAVGDKYLLCKTDSGSRTAFVGELMPIPPDLKWLVNDKGDSVSIPGRLLPFYLNDRSFRGPGLIALAAILVLLFYIVKIGLPTFRHLRRPKTHPVFMLTQRWGEPGAVARAIRQEAKEPRYTMGNGWSVSDRFLVQSDFFNFNVLRVEDLLWAYKKVIKHRVNFVPTHTTHAAVVACYGGNVTLRGQAEHVDGVLNLLSSRAPWAIFGFSQELKKRVEDSPTAFCNEVDGRRRSWNEQVRAAAAGRKEGSNGASSPSVRDGDVSVVAVLSLANAMVGGQHELFAGGQRRVRVVYPAGIDAGQTLRVKGLGLPAKAGAEPGDLYVQVTLQPHPRFQRRGDDLESRVKISRTAAAVGGPLRIELPDASVVNLDIPPGTELGARLTIAHEGMPRLGRPGRGDLHVLLDDADSPLH